MGMEEVETGAAPLLYRGALLNSQTGSAAPSNEEYASFDAGGLLLASLIEDDHSILSQITLCTQFQGNIAAPFTL